MMKLDGNIILIGMPGVGKSTVGDIVARQLGADFLDTDDLIRNRFGMSLQKLIDLEGLSAFRKHEETILFDLDLTNHVIATGGSVVYYPIGMKHLKKLGQVVWLNVDIKDLESRLSDTVGSRGIAITPEQTLMDLYNERKPLYERYADIVIQTSGRTPEDTAFEICRAVSLRKAI